MSQPQGEGQGAGQPQGGGQGGGGGDAGGGGGTGGGGRQQRPEFKPNEALVTIITGMGVSRNAAVRALYYTGNNNADMAAAWIFENQDQDLDASVVFGRESDSEDDADLPPGVEGFLDEGDFFKMVFVVNAELDMGVGKIAAQVAHATMGVYKILMDNHQRYGEMILQWEQFGETKIVLKGDSTAQLFAMSEKAGSLRLVKYLVQDAGKTQVAPGSITVLGIMGKNDLVDQVTGDLPLL